MTRLIARLVLAMLILPISVAIFVLLFFGVIVGRGGPPSVTTVLIIWCVVYSFIAVYWTTLWKDVIVWTPTRKSRTTVAAFWALGAGAVIALIMWPHVRNEEAIAVLFGGGVPPIVWVLATVFIWRETAQERLERLKAAGTDTIVCSVCGYNMTGLKEARCPECGAQYTLDQLYAAQPARDKAALEDE